MGLDSFVDKIRINKCALTLAAVSVTSLGLLASSFVDTDYKLIGLAFSPFSILGIGGSFMIGLLQNSRYNRLTEIARERGVDKEAFPQYMNHPCGRSVVKAVLKRSGNYNAYPELSEKYPIKRIC
tara:strand:- start:451 stop:825 length:375 start_codon:yes stop_codon:yes gene_type:complete